MFVQDKISLFNDRLQLTLGIKIEHNDYTGVEVQPNARILYKLAERHRVWAAVSRAVRTPNRSDHDQVNNTGRVVVLGNEDFVSEDVLAYEIGYRMQLRDNLSIDIAGFFNDYDNLQTAEREDSVSGLIPIVVDNKMDGETFGLEVSTDWDVTDSWKITAGYTFLQMQLHMDKTSTDAGNDVSIEGNSPQNQALLRSYLDLPYNLEFDTSFNYVDHLSTSDIDSYLRLDVRLGWQPTDSLDVSLGVRDLLTDDHLEIFQRSGGVVETEIERSVYASIRWKF
jgi:iron complex outermembrane receptor protein